MKSIDINSRLVEGYMKLLSNLAPDNKLDLISKLTLSVKTDTADKKKSFYDAFGAWESKQCAEDVIETLRDSRILKRQNEKLNTIF